MIDINDIKDIVLFFLVIAVIYLLFFKKSTENFETTSTSSSTTSTSSSTSSSIESVIKTEVNNKYLADIDAIRNYANYISRFRIGYLKKIGIPENITSNENLNRTYTNIINKSIIELN